MWVGVGVAVPLHKYITVAPSAGRTPVRSLPMTLEYEDLNAGIIEGSRSPHLTTSR